MSKWTIILLTVLTSCNLKQEKTNQIKANNENRSTRSTHEYTFGDKGDVLTDTETTYDLIDEIVTGKTTTISNYSYERGRVTRIDTKSEIPQLSQIKFFNFDKRDSLTLELWINFNGDTTALIKKTYDSKGNKIELFERRLFSKSLADLVNNSSKIAYDTFARKTKNKFKGNLCIESVVENNLGEIESVEIYQYENNKKVKTETFKFIGTTKYPFSKTNYDYSKYSKGEYTTFDSDGIPKDFLRVEMRNNKLYKKIWVGERFEFIEFFNDSGQVIRDLDTETQEVTSYTYDSKGNKKEIHSYKMPDSEAKQILENSNSN